MKYTAKDIANILSLPAVNAADIVVEQLLTDSRKLVFAAQTLFFALPGPPIVTGKQIGRAHV